MDEGPLGDLPSAIVAVLRPRGVGGRLRARVRGRGWTVRQIIDALPATALPQPADRAGVAGEREIADQVRAALDGLVVDGRVRRERARLRYTLNTKGSRIFEVDVYRLA